MYEMIGEEGCLERTQELFSTMDQNSDGSVSPKEIIALIQKDKSLLNLLQGRL